MRSLFQKFRAGLTKTAQNLAAHTQALFGGADGRRVLPAQRLLLPVGAPDLRQDFGSRGHAEIGRVQRLLERLER